MRQDRGNHHEKLGRKRISCASQLTIPDMPCTTPNPAGKNTNMKSSKPNQASRTPDFSYPLVSSRFVPIFITHFSFSNIIAEHKVKLSLSISPCNDHELTLTTAYTKYNIHRVQHTPSTAYTDDCLSSLHCHDHELTPECCFSFHCASLQDQPPSTSFPWNLKGNVTSSHSDGCKLTH
jgi:hypothetical protein